MLGKSKSHLVENMFDGTIENREAEKRQTE
jgi:hypothetical protein